MFEEFMASVRPSECNSLTFESIARNVMPQLCCQARLKLKKVNGKEAQGENEEESFNTVRFLFYINILFNLKLFILILLFKH